MFDFKHLELKKVNHILCVLYTDNVYFIDDYMQHLYHSETANYIKKKKYLKIPKMPEGDIFFLAFNLRVSKKVSFQVRVTVWW